MTDHDYVRNARMTRVGSSGSQSEIQNDTGLTNVQREMAAAWQRPSDHVTFVERTVELLEPHHQSVAVQPQYAPGYEVIYYRDHQPSCTWQDVGVCVSSIIVGDPNVNPIRLTIETLIPSSD